MGLELWDSSPVFAARMAECDQALRPWVDWSLREVLGDPEALARVDVVQPASWAVAVSLAALWADAGVTPVAVLGHSQGEIAAACVAGAITLQQAAKIIAIRSTVIGRSLSGKGTMGSVAWPATRVAAAIADCGADDVGIAAINSPGSTIVSGPVAGIETLVAHCVEQGARARRIPVDYASHSAQVDSITTELRDLLGDTTPTESVVPMFSTVTGDRIDTTTLTTDYWITNLRNPVRFADTITALHTQGFTRYLEISTHPVLTTAIDETTSTTTTTTVLHSLTRDNGNPTRWLTALAQAHTTGIPITYPHPPTPLLDLPTYPFQHTHYWLTPTPTEVEPEEAVGGEVLWGAVDRGDVDKAAEELDLPSGDGVGALRELMPILTRWRNRNRQRHTLDSWRYRISWKSVTAPPARLTGTWLVLATSGDPWAERLGDALSTHGAHAVSVILDPGSDDFDARLSAAFDGRDDVTGVLSLLGLDEQDGLYGTVALTQALRRLEVPAPLWVATRGACAVDGGLPVRPAQAQVWALGQVIGLELPQSWGGLVDLPEQWGQRAAALFASALSWGTGEDQIAVRPAGIRVRRLVRATSPAGGVWRPRGTVVVTGGTGGVGSHVARWLSDAGAEHVLLLSRSGAMSGEVPAGMSVVACDVADRAALAEVLAGIPADRPLSAVVHAAGVTAYLDTLSSTPAEFATVLSGKVDGARNLDELTADLDLDAFVLFSSGAAIWGSHGNGAYAAANAYLDGLAQDRRGRGLPATSVSWGGWRSTGMADADAGDLLTRLGLRMMDPELAVAALAEAVGADETLLTVTDMDWARFAPGYTMARRRPLIEDIPEVAAALREEAEAAEPGPVSESALKSRLTTLAEGDRRDSLLDLVRTEAAAVLGHGSIAELAAAKPFQSLGFDSLTALELRNRLGTATGLRLPATLIFDYPTAAQLARHLDDTLFGEAVAVAPVADAASVTDDPLVIVGMACRFPGGVRRPDDLWRLVTEERDEMTGFPADRGWGGPGMYDPARGAMAAGRGAFLEAAGDFDAGFFGISPREALAMDPQQRLLLESSWEALEDAGIDPLSLRGSRTGVFVGGTPQEYGAVLMSSPAVAGGYALTGSSGSVMSGRVSYTLGLEGPAVTVDTACSSSLTALHLAGQALRGGECDLALAGGVTVMSTPGAFAEFSRQGGLAADGRCKAFADAADGTGWGEGVAMLVVERLSDARRNAHPVLAVVRGSAVNQDGASNGLTAPNGPSQQRVIAQALANAGVTAGDVDAVEGHGTGTRLGDPIEAQALLATYGQGRDDDAPLWLGSLKSNIGHTQYAAGAGGVIKMVLAMRHGVLPRTLHVDEPSSQVDWAAGDVRLLTEAREWPTGRGVRRAGVSSFGISGTNVHVILEEPPADLTPALEPGDSAGAGVTSWPVSARSAAALPVQAARLLAWLDETPDADVSDIAHSLATTRAALEHRGVVFGADRAELRAGLAVLADGGSAPGVIRDLVRDGKVAFLFPGQGAQRPGMGRELAAAYPVFAEALDEVCGYFDLELDRPLREVMFAEPGTPEAEALNRTGFTQPALFAIGVALHRLLAHWGVRADVVAGHSIGELAAAHVAGVWSLADACRVVAARARLMEALPAGGAMFALAATEAEVTAELDGETVGIAAVNGPAAVVVSGDEAAVSALAEHFAGLGRRVKRLPVSHAFHSPLVEPMLEEFAAVLADVEFAEPRVTVVSNLTGEPATAEQLRDPGYWVRHVRGTVRFADGVRTLAHRDVRTVLELGPGSTLTAMVTEARADVADAPDLLSVPVLRGEDGEVRALARAVARAHSRGVDVDWPALTGRRPHAVALPTYAFQHERFWLEPPAAAAGTPSSVGLSATGHPVLTAGTELSGTDGYLFTGRLSAATHSWVADHALGGSAVLPGTAFVEFLLHAGDRVGLDRIEELTLAVPLLVPATGGLAVQLVLGGLDETGLRTVGIFSRPDGDSDAPWTRNATGLLGTGASKPLSADDSDWPPLGAEPVDLTAFYDDLAEDGVVYGEAFQGLRALWRRPGEVFAEVELPARPETEAGGFGVHPALLDAALQPLALGVPSADGSTVTRGVPFSFAGVSLFAEGAITARVSMRGTAGDTASVLLADETGEPLVVVDAVTLRAPAATPASTEGQGNDLFRLAWRPASVAVEGIGTDWAMLGFDPLEMRPRLLEAGLTVSPYLDPQSLDDALDAGVPVPRTVVVFCAEGTEGGTVATTHALTHRVLGTLRHWLAEDRLSAHKLVLVTRGAVSVDPDERPLDLAASAAWGLVRSAQSENPGRVVLADLDDDAESYRALAGAVAGGEPQFALRHGTLLVPRLSAVEAGATTVSDGPEGTVLVTGAGGALGAEIVRHLVTARGARHLLLANRSGEFDPELRAELVGLGARVDVVACDVADREAVAGLLATVPDGQPLKWVVHVAGVLDDGLVGSLDAERIDRVLRPKVDGAWNLHELTAGLPLEEFVLFSSAAGVLGSQGQGNYAAANAFLDALATLRRSDGLPARSLAWGWWDVAGGMAAELDDASRTRMARGGITAFTPEHGLAVFDTALGLGSDATLVPIRLRGGTAPAGVDVPAVLRDLIRVTQRRAARRAGLRDRFPDMVGIERGVALLDLVRTETADVLGHAGAGELEGDRAFSELGFDSLTSVELRNRLNTELGLRLPPTLAFDYPTIGALADELRVQLEASLDQGSVSTGARRVELDPETALVNGVETLYRHACEVGQFEAANKILTTTARLRRSFTDADAVEKGPELRRLASGDGHPPLICFPSTSVWSSDQEFVSMASPLRGLRDMWSLMLPGFVPGEEVAANLDALADYGARRILAMTGGGPVTLAGRSSGGMVAHAVAARLEALGSPARGIVLLDTYLSDNEQTHYIMPVMEMRTLEMEKDFGRMTGVRLTAMASYLTLFEHWEPTPVSASTLLIRATEFVGAQPDAEEVPRSQWQTTWPLAHDVVDVPGNHYSMVEEHQDITAHAMHDWLLTHE